MVEFSLLLSLFPSSLIGFLILNFFINISMVLGPQLKNSGVKIVPHSDLWIVKFRKIIIIQYRTIMLPLLGCLRFYHLLHLKKSSVLFVTVTWITEKNQPENPSFPTVRPTTYFQATWRCMPSV